MMKDIIDVAKGEIGYHDINGKSKYSEELFPGKPHISWCVPFVEWLYFVVYGKQKALNMLHITIDDFVDSVPALMLFFKRANMWHRKVHKVKWLIFLRMNYEWSNHVELIVGIDGDEITSIGGNCGGEVKMNVWNRNDPRIAGYAEIVYDEEGTEVV